MTRPGLGAGPSEKPEMSIDMPILAIQPDVSSPPRSGFSAMAHTNRQLTDIAT